MTDPWGLVIAAITLIAALVLGWGAGIALTAGVAVIAVRVISEYVVPRGAQLEVRDSQMAQELQVRASLSTCLTSIRGRASEQVEQKVGAISQVILDILARRDGAGGQSPELFVVLRTATDYLPKAIDTYTRLPAGYATTRLLAEGKTAQEILLDQLGLLEKEMTEVADAFSKNDLDRLRAHGRFLANRFGRSELELK